MGFKPGVVSLAGQSRHSVDGSPKISTALSRRTHLSERMVGMEDQSIVHVKFLKCYALKNFLATSGRFDRVSILRFLRFFR